MYKFIKRIVILSLVGAFFFLLYALGQAESEDRQKCKAAGMVYYKALRQNAICIQGKEL